MRGKVSLIHGTPGPFAEEFCVKVKFPQGLVPTPPDESKRQQIEHMVGGTLNSMPHTDVTIDGNNVAIFHDVGVFRQVNKAYVGIRHNGAPFGFGIVPPTTTNGVGEWTPLIKFPTWTQGAGEMTEFSCAESAITSAAEMLANPQMAQTLDVFDELVASLRSSQPMSVAFASLPFRPSLLFKSAAATAAVEPVGFASDLPVQSWSVLVVAGVAGMAGAAALLIALKITSLASKREVLLSNMA